jgi:hypothetical protein
MGLCSALDIRFQDTDCTCVHAGNAYIGTRWFVFCDIVTDLECAGKVTTYGIIVDDHNKPTHTHTHTHTHTYTHTHIH